MSFVYPGPQCQVRNWFIDPIDTGTSARTTNHPPGPHAHRNRHHHNKPSQKARVQMKVPVVVFDDDMVLAFLHAVARSAVLVRHVNVTWNPTQKPGLLERLLFWKDSKFAGTSREPGSMTVTWGDESRIDQQTVAATRELLLEFNTRLSRSPKSGVSFLEEQEKARERNIATIEAAYQEVTSANAELRSSLKWHLAPLIVTKAGATVAVKVAAFLETKLKGFFVDLGYDVLVAVGTELSQGSDAKVAIVAGGKEAGKDALQESVEKGTEKAGAKIAGKMEDSLLEKSAGARALRMLYDDLLKSSVERAEREILTKVSKNNLGRLGGVLSRGVRKGLRQGLPKAVKGVFGIVDIYQALDQARTEFREL